MVNGMVELPACPGNLGFEPGDAPFQLGNGQGIEILAAERNDGIVIAFGQEFVRVHVGKVDRKFPAVNKPGPPFCSNRIKLWSACHA
jgi:hypothetical protein